MRLVEKHIVKKTDKRFQELDNVCFLSKNLYNSALYLVRQHYFETKKFLNYIQVDKIMKENNQQDYRALKAKVSQQILKLVEKNFKSFFALLKMKLAGKYDGDVSIPNYLKKDGRFVTPFTEQAISTKILKDGVIKLSGVEATFKTDKNNINQVRVVPRLNYIKVEVVYDVPEAKPKQDNGRYCSIDLGINNLATISSNVIKPFIINGKPIKCINQYYNKRKAELQSLLPGNRKKSKKIKRISLKRDNKINDYFHKATRYITNHLVSNNINVLIIGKNIGWKQEVNIGKVNNQKFVSIPFNKFVSMIEYKAKLEGIRIIKNEESYTSKCSFLDNESIEKHDVYIGKRIKRGLFKSGGGKLINADLNGSLNILRKVVGDFDYPIEVCSTPKKINF